MPFCPMCLVELAPQTRNCPLCGAPSVETLEKKAGDVPARPPMHSSVAYAPEVHDADEKEKITPAEFRKMAVEILSVSIGIVLVVTFFIDVVFFHGITWSRYTSITMVMLWLCSAIPMILWRHPWLIYSVLGPTTLLAVFLWFLFSGNIAWFLPAGLPIMLLLEAAIVSAGTLIAIQKKKGLNAVGVALATIGVLCAGIDITLSLNLLGKFSMGWSMVVVMSAIPVAGFFFYLHYRVTNRASLRKLFRL